MKSYIDITGKYLRVQKKRSVLTVIGILLSVALITGVGTIFTSMYDVNMRVTIKNNGDYFAAVTGVPGDKAGALAVNVDLEKAGTSQELGFAAYAANEPNGIDPPYKYLSVTSLDGGAMSMLPYTLQDGRMPEDSGEIVLDHWALKYLDGAGIGSVVRLDHGTRTLPDGTITANNNYNSDPNETFVISKTLQYTVVGLLKPSYISDRNFARAVTFHGSASLPETESYTVFLKLKTSDDIQRRVRRIVSAAGLDVSEEGKSSIQFNDRILRLYAQSLNEVMNDSVITILFIIVLLILIATVAVIYNAFNISVIERVSQFGLLRCVGATPRQIRKIVFREAMILGAIGIPVGIASGILAMGVVFSVVSAIAPDMIVGGLRLVLSPYLFVFSILVGAFTIYLSALLPARKAGRVSPMEAVRGAGAYKKEKYRKTDRHRLVLKLLGAEGWMAWKNLGRNRKRFYITVFSMVISIVLFIVFSSLVGFAYQSEAVDSSDMPSYVLNSYQNGGKLNLEQREIAAIGSMNAVDYMLLLSETYAEVKLPPDKLEARASDFYATHERDEKGNVLLLNSNLICYSGESLNGLKRSIGLNDLDEYAFLEGEGAILINGGMFYDNNLKRMVLGEVTTLRPGDPVDVVVRDIDGEEPAVMEKTLDVLAVVEKGMPGYSRNGSGGVYMIVSEKLFAQLAPAASTPQRLFVMTKPGVAQTEVKTWLEEYTELNPDCRLTDYEEAAKSARNVWIVMSIFLYGFVSVISLIGSLNIINTISTNIIIRTRELSVMRAIGMNDGSVRKMVAMESILHGVAAALIGSVGGTALSWLLYNSMIAVREFPWTLPWQQILVAVGAAAIVAVVSALVPLRRINSGIIMEGIRGEE